MVEELGEGARLLLRDPVLGALTGAWGLYFFAFFVFWGQYPLYATRDLGLSPAAFGVVLSVVAVGGVVGALANERVTRRFGLGPHDGRRRALRRARRPARARPPRSSAPPRWCS